MPNENTANTPSCEKKKDFPAETESSGLVEQDLNPSLFRAIAEGAEYAIIVVDLRGKILYWNPASERLFVYTRSEIAGKSLEIIIPDRYQEEYHRALNSFRQKRNHLFLPRIFESEAVKKGGVEFPIEVSVTFIQFNAECHAVCMVRDISHWRSALKELSETLASSQLMCNNQKDAIILVDMDTDRVLDVNKASIDMYGFSREEFLNMRSKDIFSEKEAGPIQRKSVNAFLHKKKNGTLFQVEITACVFMWKGRKTTCATIRDVSGLDWIGNEE